MREQVVKFYPAYDKRNPDPSKSYGIHGVELLMLLKGPEGAVQFKVSTNWQLPNVKRETDARTLALAKLNLRAPNDEIEEKLVGSGFAESAKYLARAKRCLGGAQALDQVHLDCMYHPMASDIGYHSYVPMYDEQKPISESCEWLEGSPCYYDGSSLNAERVFTVLLNEGSDGVWKELEDYYNQTFESIINQPNQKRS